MDAEFWLERWREGQTGFHLQRVTPLLQKYWPTLAIPAGSRVLVPLCGKSLDMAWLAGQGFQVLGVELSQLAVDAFFEENKLHPEVSTSPFGKHYTAGAIEIICGDIFGLDAQTLANCVGVYDRAALVALPADMRPRYVTHIYSQLADSYQGLLLTLEYEQSQMDGPPFSVAEDEVQALFSKHSDVRLTDRRSILEKEPKFKARGLTSLDTAVYQLSRKATA
ncbi:thiopurine S-methyltransferase [Alcaligenaceae bacterium]|nr:thiopurine S-methyltransferase [Alcaligenaceae bacterium]